MKKIIIFTLPKGFSETAILYTVVIIGLALAGGLFINFRKYPVPQLQIPNGGVICCDTGNGNACQPQTDPSHPTITFNNEQYALLKSTILSSYCHRHRADSGVKTPAGDPIILDNSNELNNKPGECGTGGQDQLMCNVNGNKTCIPIPNDEFIYVCRANCFTTPADQCCDQDAQGFGNPNTVYDVYYRLSDLPKTGIPNVVKNCDQCGNVDNDYHCGTPPGRSPTGVNPNGNPQIVISPSPYPQHKSLQLHTFPFAQNAQGGPTEWMRSFCKPAINLYPPQKEPVNVQVNPKGPMLLTLPTYPIGGWNVIAYPDGRIDYGKTSYDYLFYEARIPDELLTKQNTGYVVTYDKLSDLFNSILPKLGLNTKEEKEFEIYWLGVLPKSPYYLITIIPQAELNSIAPLTIDPVPDNLIRVALNFQPIDKKVSITPPTLTPVLRTGFTVVEWGGLLKKDKNHTFTCLM